MLSIFLLLQRNKQSIANLIAIGYTRRKVAIPYQLIVVATNLISMLSAMLIVVLVRRVYIPYLVLLSPDYTAGGLGMAWMVVLGLWIALSGINAWMIHRKIG